MIRCLTSLIKGNVRGLVSVYRVAYIRPVKNIFIISFIALYLLLTIGMNILVHTCGGESEATLVTTNAEDPCACGDEMTAEDLCCQTELKSVKIDDVQTVTAANIERNLVVIGILPSVEYSIFNVQYSTFNLYHETSPPPNKDFQISNSVFLI